jgi:DMSO reductase anchor subunit
VWVSFSNHKPYTWGNRRHESLLWRCIFDVSYVRQVVAAAIGCLFLISQHCNRSYTLYNFYLIFNIVICIVSISCHFKLYLITKLFKLVIFYNLGIFYIATYITGSVIFSVIEKLVKISSCYKKTREHIIKWKRRP